MIQIDLRNKVVLITGGTKGIGLEAGLQFAQAGAKVYLTYKWGSADTEQLYEKFRNIEALPPVLLEADVSRDEDTDKLLTEISKHEKKIDVFISNVAYAQRTMSLDEYKKTTFFKSLEYSAWPLIEYTRKIKRQFNVYPRQIVGISSDGPDHFYSGYDFVAASKALLELFAKYLSVHLLEEGSRVNIIRFGPVKTESLALIFGEEYFEFIKTQGIPETMILKAEECGKAILALCSGLLDAMNGQIITVDNGVPFQDNLMMRYLAAKKEKV